jgi:hypothetical protein
MDHSLLSPALKVGEQAFLLDKFSYFSNLITEAYPNKDGIWSGGEKKYSSLGNSAAVQALSKTTALSKMPKIMYT